MEITGFGKKIFENITFLNLYLTGMDNENMFASRTNRHDDNYSKSQTTVLIISINYIQLYVSHFKS